MIDELKAQLVQQKVEMDAVISQEDASISQKDVAISQLTAEIQRLRKSQTHYADCEQ